MAACGSRALTSWTRCSRGVARTCRRLMARRRRASTRAGGSSGAFCRRARSALALLSAAACVCKHSCATCAPPQSASVSSAAAARSGPQLHSTCCACWCTFCTLCGANYGAIIATCPQSLAEACVQVLRARRLQAARRRLMAGQWPEGRQAPVRRVPRPLVKADVPGVPERRFRGRRNNVLRGGGRRVAASTRRRTAAWRRPLLSAWRRQQG
jgi:hypothetical protein